MTPTPPPTNPTLPSSPSPPSSSSSSPPTSPPIPNPKEHRCLCSRPRTRVIDRLTPLRHWMTLDPDNLVFRRFESLSVRNLLYLQHELADLEAKLEGLDGDNSVRIEEDVPRYDELVLRSREVLACYSEAFFAYQRMKSLPGTPGYMLRVLEGSDESRAGKAFRNEHAGCVSGLGDLSSVVNGEKGVVHRWMDERWRITSLLSRIENPKQSKSSLTYTYSEKVLWYIDQFVINCCVVTLVGIPMVVLTYVPTMTGKLVAVLGFVVVAAPLTAVISSKSLTSTNMPLMLAYAAILVAFLNQSSGSGSKTGG